MKTLDGFIDFAVMILVAGSLATGLYLAIRFLG
jgi:hypothetical protein